jgi:hypothetical protein
MLWKWCVLFYKIVILEEVYFSIPVRILNTYSTIRFETDECNRAVGKTYFLHFKLKISARRWQDFLSVEDKHFCHVTCLFPIKTPLKLEKSGHNLLAVTKHHSNICCGGLALYLVTAVSYEPSVTAITVNKAFMILLEIGLSYHSLTTRCPGHLTSEKDIVHCLANLCVIPRHLPTRILHHASPLEHTVWRPRCHHLGW